MNLSPDKLNLSKLIYLDIDPVEDAKIKCLDALIDHAQDIANQYPGPFTLFVSGGIDSQAMLYVWKLAGIPFRALHVDYMGFNDNDINECIEFCKQQDIELETIQFDILHFLENDLDGYAKEYQCSSPQICTHMAMSKLVENGTRIFGGNLAIENSLSLDNTIYGIQRYATLTGVNLVPFFLSGSEKVAKASILASINTSKLVSSYEHKCELYKAIGIPIVPQAAKTTGFERLKDYYDLFPERVSKQEKIAYSKYPSKRVFDQLFRYRYLIQLNNQYVPNLVVRGI